MGFLKEESTGTLRFLSLAAGWMVVSFIEMRKAGKDNRLQREDQEGSVLKC